MIQTCCWSSTHPFCMPRNKNEERLEYKRIYISAKLDHFIQMFWKSFTIFLFLYHWPELSHVVSPRWGTKKYSLLPRHIAALDKIWILLLRMKKQRYIQWKLVLQQPVLLAIDIWSMSWLKKKRAILAEINTMCRINNVDIYAAKSCLASTTAEHLTAVCRNRAIRVTSNKYVLLFSY